MTEKLEVIAADREAVSWIATHLRASNAEAAFATAARHRLSHSAEKEALIEALEAWRDRLRESDHDDVRGPYYGEHNEHVIAEIGTLLSMRNNGNG